MIPRVPIAVRSLLAFCTAAVLLAACATDPDFAPRPAHQRIIFIDNLNITDMNQVIQRGFAEIKNRAYDDPDIDTLFTAALASFSNVDPEISVSVSDGHVKIVGHGVELKDIGPAPHENIAAWTRTALLAILQVRRDSALLHASSEEALYQTMFTAALAKLDPYSRYSSREVAIRTRLVRDGVIGLGIRVAPQGDGMQIQAIVDGGPAEKAGLTINDVILTVDGVRLGRMALSDARRKLDGQSDSVATLLVKRPGVSDPFTLTARRELIVPDTVTTKVSGGIAELHVQSFNQRTAAAVERAVDNARAQSGGDLRGIIIDFRSDPGGLLDQAVDMADLFLDGGTITSLAGRHPGAKQFYASHNRDIAPGVPIAVIVDGRTASAAEIVAAALQDNGRAVVVGTESLGKGSVQTVVRLPNGGEIALTWTHTTTPRGAGLHGLGVLPDVCLADQIQADRGHTTPTIDDALAQIAASTSPSLDDRKRWRLPKDDEATHGALRTVCPAEAHLDRDVDTEVARRLLNDPVLLARAASANEAQLAVKP